MAPNLTPMQYDLIYNCASLGLPPWEPPLPSSSCVCHRSTRSTRPLSASPASSPSSPCTTTCASSTPSRRHTLLASRTPRLARSTTTSAMRTLTATSQPESFSTTPTATSTGFSLVVVDLASLGVLEARSVGLLEGVEDAHVVVHGDEGDEAGDAESGLVLLVERWQPQEEEGSGGSHGGQTEGGAVVDQVILHRGEIGRHVGCCSLVV